LKEEPMRTLKGSLLALVASSALLACGDDELLPARQHRRDLTTNPGGENAAASKACPTHGDEYLGFRQTKLVLDRVEAPIGADRARVKPVSALRGEYPRVLAQAPASFDALATSFGSEPDRWFHEPIMSAVALSSMVRTAFEACLAYTASPPEYGIAPTATTAASTCASLERKVWSRTPFSAEVDACRDVAIVDSVSETDPRRRWAYACAAIMSAAGFMTY
jgi:hypothetical protein